MCESFSLCGVTAAPNLYFPAVIAPEMLIQAIATVRGLALVYKTPAQIRGGACTEVSLGGGVAHAYGYTIGYTMVLV